MSRFRRPSEAIMAQTMARMTTQRQAAATVSAASNTAAAIEAVEAIDAEGISTTLDAYAETLANLNARLEEVEAAIP